MKGLLHRLAARAAGTAVPVRSDMTLPFAVGAFGWAEAESAMPVVAPVASVPSAATLAPARAPLAAMPMHSPTRIDNPITLPVATQAALPAQSSSSLVEALGSRAPIAPDVSPSALLPSQHASIDVDATTPAIAQTSHWARASSAVQYEPRPLMANAVTRSDPMPLMPTPAASDRSPVDAAAPRRAIWPSAAPAAASHEPTEVHIHIGRIDVTAQQEAPPPRRRAPAATAPMSLDGYLAKRSQA